MEVLLSDDHVMKELPYQQVRPWINSQLGGLLGSRFCLEECQ